MCEVTLSQKLLSAPPLPLVTLNPAKHINQMSRVNGLFSQEIFPSSFSLPKRMGSWERSLPVYTHTHVDVYICTPHTFIHTYVCITVHAGCSIWLSVKFWPLPRYNWVGSEFRAGHARFPEEMCFKQAAPWFSLRPLLSLQVCVVNINTLWCKKSFTGNRAHVKSYTL